MSEQVVCLFCKTNYVPIEDWNKRCSSCKAIQKQKDHEEQLKIKTSIPAAIITTEDGRKVFVDKFGRELDNPGYDLATDPHGYKATGQIKDKTTIV